MPSEVLTGIGMPPSSPRCSQRLRVVSPAVNSTSAAASKVSAIAAGDFHGRKDQLAAGMGHEVDDRDRRVGPGLQRVARVDLAPRLVFPVAHAAVEPAVGGGQELHGRLGGDGGVVIPELHRALVDVHAAGAGERGLGNLADRLLDAGQVDPQLHHRIARACRPRSRSGRRPGAWHWAGTGRSRRKRRCPPARIFLPMFLLTGRRVTRPS